MKSKAILSGFALLMLVYTGWRSYDQINGSLAGVDAATRFVIGAAFLAFSEIGLLLWLHVGRPGSTTDVQETAATALIWVDFVGILLLGLGDMLRHNTLYQVDMSVLDPVLFIAPWILVAANLGGYLVYSMADSDEQLNREERRLRHEETGLEIEARRGAVRELRANREAIGGKLAPHYYRDITNRITGRTAARFDREAAALPATPLPAIEQPAAELPATTAQPNPTRARSTRKNK